MGYSGKVEGLALDRGTDSLPTIMERKAGVWT